LQKNQDLLEIVGVNPNSSGGTETMIRRLFNEIPRNVLEKFYIAPSRVTTPIDKTKLTILWCADCAGDGMYDHLKNNGWRAWDKIIFVSYWQMNMFQLIYGIPASRCHVMQNAIDPIPSVAKDPNKIRFFFHPVPRKGLALLIPVFKKLCETNPDIELELYSSFKLYGQPEGDAAYEQLYNEAKSIPQIHVHDAAPNDIIRQEIAKCDIFAYPSIFSETSCIALMEAMSAGLLCLTPTLGALPETGANWTWCYPYHEDPNKHANMFFHNCLEAIKSYRDPVVQSRLKSQKSYTDVFYNWNIRSQEWNNLLQQMIIDGKVADTKEMFIYRS
jgi:UDP-glucose:(glucosyl)LPS alpha-1,2-glucosyltransferase